MNFLYWNIQNKDLSNLIAELVLQFDIDIIILSEVKNISKIKLLKTINADLELKFTFQNSPVNDPIILTRYKSDFEWIYDDLGICCRKFNHPLGLDFNLIVLHLGSKLYQDKDDQVLNSTRVREVIDVVEKKSGHNRTILVGDLNMNPYESGLVGADGIHAIIDKNIALKEKRTIGGKERYFFYNPMWSHFGYGKSKPLGTYYYNNSRQVNHYWHIFDQVIIRPQLIKYFDEDNLEVISETKSGSLLNNNGQPNQIKASDHLPIRLSFNLIRSENVK
ncbi:MAG: endonuclease/exonuclease/phosphatase family protein [Ignavibacteriales bacterium]|nr:MAG: endonuclease/exonuclease/phosphatase family protein [Ignavibacteriales bacterium]